MKNLIRNFLVLGLIVACVPSITAAPKAVKSQTTKMTPKEAAKIKKSGLSFKTKAIAAVSVVATVAIAYLVYRYKTAKSEVTLDDILRYEPKTVPAYQVPAGQAGRLMRNLQAHNGNFQQAMRNPQSRAHIEQLFNDAQFAELMNGRMAEYIDVQLPALFNDEQVMHFSEQPNFGQEVINRFREVLRKIEL